jgi:hypothetical protein
VSPPLPHLVGLQTCIPHTCSFFIVDDRKTDTSDIIDSAKHGVKVSVEGDSRQCEMCKQSAAGSNFLRKLKITSLASQNA